MKKFLILTCMTACLFGMSACGNSEQMSSYQQYKTERAVAQVEERLIPIIQQAVGSASFDELHEYTSEEVEWLIENQYGVQVDGNAFVSALDSFSAAYEKMGDAGEITGAEAVPDDDQIIVNVSIHGSSADAKAEFVLSNDIFLTMESASLNPVSTVADSMGKAGLNMLLGMGTVFMVLILISLIISCFSLIPRIQAQFAKKKEKAAAETGIDNGVAQIFGQEEAADVSDDLELAAVIAAAVAASEGAASTDGFVVRSIKRRRTY